MSIVQRLKAEGRWLEEPGGWFGDSLPDRTHVASTLTRVVSSWADWSVPELFMFPRLSEDGRKIAAKSNSDPKGRTWLYTRQHEWFLTERESYGVNGHIFDLAGNLITASGGPHAPSQGFRYVDEQGRIVPGHETYADPSRNIWEYTTRGDITIGQGNDGVIAITPQGRFKLAPGHTTFVRFRRWGNQCSISFTWPDRVVHLWPTVAELAEFPKEDQPKPEPEPEPEPEPTPMSTPNMRHVVDAVASQYGHLLQTNTFASCGEFVQRVLAAIAKPAEWGHVGKNPGEAGHTVNGIRFSHDVIWHKPSNRQVDILGYAAANSHPDPKEVKPGPAHVTWDEIPREHYRANNPWLPPVPLGADPKPDPDKPPPPPPAGEYVVDLGLVLRPIIARLEAATAALEARLAALEARPGGDTMPGKIALKSAHGKYVCAEADGRVVADRDNLGAWEQFEVEKP